MEIAYTKINPSDLLHAMFEVNLPFVSATYKARTKASWQALDRAQLAVLILNLLAFELTFKQSPIYRAKSMNILLLGTL